MSDLVAAPHNASHKLFQAALEKRAIRLKQQEDAKRRRDERRNLASQVPPLPLLSPSLLPLISLTHLSPSLLLSYLSPPPLSPTA